MLDGFWSDNTPLPLSCLPQPPVYPTFPTFQPGEKRRHSSSDDSENDNRFIQISKRPRLAIISAARNRSVESLTTPGSSHVSLSLSAESRDLWPVQWPGAAMEKTASGLSISADLSGHGLGRCGAMPMMEDEVAAQRVKEHVASFRRSPTNSQAERILKSLIQPRSREAEFPIDDVALENIFLAANAIFFNGQLARRVTWDWSHSSSPQYDSRVIGTTALRESRSGGYETLIVLSRPILADKKYNRRLVISTFLHELIHSYLFICCGFRARQCGGHTEGFRLIAEIIDDWAGRETLHLREMEANLERFRQERNPADTTDYHRVIHDHVRNGEEEWLHCVHGQFPDSYVADGRCYRV